MTVASRRTPVVTPRIQKLVPLSETISTMQCLFRNCILMHRALCQADAHEFPIVRIYSWTSEANLPLCACLFSSIDPVADSFLTMPPPKLVGSLKLKLALSILKVGLSLTAFREFFKL